MDLREFNPAVKYGVSLQNSKLDDGKILLGDSNNLAQEVTLSGDATVSDAGVVSLARGMPFVVTGSFGTPDLNGGLGGGTLMSEAALAAYGASDRTVYVTGFYARCFQSAGSGASGGSVWAGGTLSIQDSAGTSIWSFPAAYITHDQGASAGGTFCILKTTGMCGGVNRGIRLYASGGSITTNGGTIVCSAWGLVK